MLDNWRLDMGRGVARRLRALLKDKRGTYELVQFALLVPIFVIILYGSFEMLKLISIRQSLDAGTYQAARYLSVYHRSYVDQSFNRPSVDDRQRAERLIWESLLANPFVPKDAPIYVVVRYFNRDNQEIPSPIDFPCPQIPHNRSLLDDPNMFFTVRTQMTLPWRASVLGLSLGSITLTSAHSSFVDCGPWYPWPGPTNTPVPTPTP